jgi:hypothetical protein
MRRLFLLVLPVALPCWVALMAFAITVMTIADLWRPVRNFWSAPQRYRFEYGHYEYLWAGASESGRTERAIQPPRIIEPAMTPAE